MTITFVSEAEYDRAVAAFNKRIALRAKIHRIKASKRYQAMTLVERLAVLLPLERELKGTTL